MKTIFILTSSFPPKNIVGALRPFRLAKNIGREGWKVVIITQKSKKSVLDYSLLNELTELTEIHYVNSNLPILCDKIKLNKSFKSKKNYNSIENSTNKKKKFFASVSGFIKDTLNKILIPDTNIIWILLYFFKFLKSFDENKETIILTTSPPHSIHLAGLLISTIKNIPWIVDFRDPWDNFHQTGYNSIKNPLERLMELLVVKKANIIISSTYTYTKNLSNRHINIDKSKFHTVTNCFEKKIVSVPVNLDSDKFVISYTGILYPNKDPFTFFRALRSFLDQLDYKKRKIYKNIIKIQLIGSKNNSIKNVIKELRLEEVIKFIDRVQYYEAIRLTKGSDLVLLLTGLGHRTRPGWLPVKLFEYLGCKKPILAIIREGEAAGIIRATNSGYIVSSEDHQKIHKILEKEIQKKLNKDQTAPNDVFTFDKVENYEECYVMGKMISVISHALNKYYECEI
jgi:glycosyltransferase involved in cell wall biosynthesis